MNAKTLLWIVLARSRDIGAANFALDMSVLSLKLGYGVHLQKELQRLSRSASTIVIGRGTRK